MRFFLDTYALIEIMKGNIAYSKYPNEELFTSVLNLYEFYYIILRDFGEDKAKELFYDFSDLIVEIQDAHIFLASKFKLRHKDTSYADALGYAIAEKESMKFLTGDGHFKGLPNVEFVK